MLFKYTVIAFFVGENVLKTRDGRELCKTKTLQIHSDAARQNISLIIFFDKRHQSLGNQCVIMSEVVINFNPLVKVVLKSFIQKSV